MKYRLLFLFLAGFMTALPAKGEIIRLKNGVELQCEILECSEEEGLTVKRLDNGGVLSLRWEHILNQDVKSIKLARGYSDEEAKPVLVRAHRVWLKNGTFEDGLKVTSDRPGTLCLQRQGRLYYFSTLQVKDIETLEVEAKDIYTLDELYQQKMEEGPPETVLDYFALGVYCESITHYEKALEMYGLVHEQDPEYKADVIDQKLKLMNAKVQESGATALLDDAKRLLYRRKFTLALLRIVEFEENYPKSVQMADKEKLKAEILRKRHDFYAQQILTDFPTFMDRIAYKVATNKELTLESALDFAAEEMAIAIKTKLADDIYKMPVEEVEELWASRSGGSKRTSSYGTGTFILGPERAKMVPEKEKESEEEAAEGEEAAEPETLDERLKKRIEEAKKQQAKMKKKKKSRVNVEDIGRSPEEWWKTETTSNKKRLIISFFAEESGDMKILGVRFNPCPHCNGKGWLEFISTTGEENQKVPCEVCKTIGVERTVIFK